MLVVGLESMSAYGQVAKCPPHLSGRRAACLSEGERPFPSDPSSHPLPVGGGGSFVSRKMWGEVGGLSTTEQRTVFSFWCMLAAPLILGNDPRRMKHLTIEILTAPELIAISQDVRGYQAVRVWRTYPGRDPTVTESRVQLWRKGLGQDRFAIMVYNAGSNITDVPLSWNRDLPTAAAKYQRQGPRQPPCENRRDDCEQIFGRDDRGLRRACFFYVQNVSWVERKSDCMKTCNACQPARVKKGKHATALVRNAWTREFEGVFQEEFIVKRVEAHEARVYVVRFERESDGPHLLKKLAYQAVKDMTDATDQGHLVELDEMRGRVKLLEKRSEELKRMLRNTGTGLTPLVDGCVDEWTEHFPEQAHDKGGKSCYWKHKWGQCDSFGEQCSRSCGRCNRRRGDSTMKGRLQAKKVERSAELSLPAVGRNARRVAAGRNARRVEGGGTFGGVRRLASCGTASCTPAVWGAVAGSVSCGERITWLQESPDGPRLAEAHACARVATEFPAECSGCLP